MSSTNALYLVFLMTGFTVGLGHCIGMCGPIVVSLSLNLKGRSVLVPQFLFHAGRVTTYILLGGLMGLTGSFTGVASRIANLQQGVLIFAGVVIMLMGSAMAGWFHMGKSFGDHFNPEGMIARGFRRLSAPRTFFAYLPLGLLLGLLPCGPVYTALLASASAGLEAETTLEGLLAGMGLMAAFGLGTLPALSLVAKFADFRWLRSREVVYRVGSILMMIAGAYFIIRGVRY